jgi:hypothetical protein
VTATLCDHGKVEQVITALSTVNLYADSHSFVMWVTSPFFEPMNSWWLNRKHQDVIPYSFDSLADEIRKISQPNIRNDAINAAFGLTQGNLSYATYTSVFNDFLRRSRQPITDDLQCVRFIGGLANSTPDSSQVPSFTVEGLHFALGGAVKFLNDLVTDSPHFGRARPAATQSTTPRGSDHETIQWSRRQNVGNNVKVQSLDEVVVVAMEAVEAVISH